MLRLSQQTPGDAMAPQPIRYRTSLTAAALALAALVLAGCGSAGSGSSGSGNPGTGHSSAASSAAPSPSATVGQTAAGGQPAQAPPAGYQWVGIPNHVWLAVPDSWVTLNLNSLTVTQALARVRLKGLPAGTMASDIRQLKQLHALLVVDSGSVATSPSKFATNVNTFCTVSAVEPGPGIASTINSSIKAEYARIGGHVRSIKYLSDNSAAVIVRVTVDLSTASGVALHDMQYLNLTSQGQICYTTFSTDQQSKYFPLFKTIAATIKVG